MKVRLLTSFGNTQQIWNRGDDYECGADEAQRLVDAGIAEFVRTATLEKAIAKPKTEKAAK